MIQSDMPADLFLVELAKFKMEFALTADAKSISKKFDHLWDM